MTFAADIRCRLAQSVAVALTFASIGSGLFSTVPAAAAPHPAASRFGSDSIRPRVPLVSGAPRVTPRASSSAASLTCDSQFHQAAGDNPGTALNLIQNNGLAAISPTDVWAVGFKADFTTGTTIGPDAPIVERWDGSSWKSFPVANPAMGPPYNGSADLNAVANVPGATTAANNIFAAGTATYMGGTDPRHALVWHYTAGQSSGGWDVIGPSNLGSGGGDNIFYGVAAITATNVWAVGSWRQDNNAGTRRQPLIAHWDGTTFTSIAGPDPSTTSSDTLLAVSASGPSNIWAVGRSVDGGFTNSLTMHYDGTAWSIIPSPGVLGGANALYGVAVLSPTLAYAVGNILDVNSGRQVPLIQQWNGTSWSISSGPNPVAGYDNFLFSVSALSPANIWAAGGSFAPTQTGSPSDTLVEHWDGSTWKIVPSPDGASGSWNELNAILPITATSIWTGGDYINSAQTQGLTLFENLCVSPPTVTGVQPILGNATTTVAISGTDFNVATGVKFGTTDATGWHIDSNNQITAQPPAGVAGTVDVAVTNPAGTSATSTADTYIYVPPAISWQQYSLAYSDGAAWFMMDATNLNLAFTPSVDSYVILSGNADLWTSLAGVNQDLGIFVTGGIYGTNGNGRVVAWKESGGYAGTFSPNAAFVQTVIPVVAATQYQARLVWKANKATNGTIYAAAGAGPNYSPIRLTVEMIPTPTTNLVSTATTSQYLLNGNDGTTWKDMDATTLVIADFTPAATSTGLVSANADLWTTAAGVNQDIGIWISGGTYGTGGTLVGWKESGGFGGTFSPNAAYLQTLVTLTAATHYTIRLEWKTNKLTSSTIVAGAGAGPIYSPTRLTLRLFPTANTLVDGSTNKQYNRAGSTGADWTPIDSTGLQITVNPTATSVWVLSANADLFTATAGVNQDIGIFISGGAYGAGTLVAWKESGGYGGTFSPNAAFVQTVIPLATGTTYTITLEWKANKATGGTIYAAAGGGPVYSPTRITAQLLN